MEPIPRRATRRLGAKRLADRSNSAQSEAPTDSSIDRLVSKPVRQASQTHTEANMEVCDLFERYRPFNLPYIFPKLLPLGVFGTLGADDMMT